MKHKILRMKNEQQAEAKETRVPKGQGVIFIKTRMSDDKIHVLVTEMLEVADATGVDNSLTMQLISLGLIAFLYLPFLIGQVIWYIILKTRKSSTSL